VSGAEYILLAGYIIGILVFIPTGISAAESCKTGAHGGEPLPAWYADFIAALGVGLWPLFLLVGIILRWKKGG
jgi:hypothetical protein